jgi:predicted acetyltransferase
VKNFAPLPVTYRQSSSRIPNDIEFRYPCVPMTLTVDEAGRDELHILRNLGELYTHDFSELTRNELNDAGRFDHDFWQDFLAGSETAYLFRVDGHLAGFALVARGSRLSDHPEVHDVAEFFVVRRYRRHGIGARAAAELFRRHHGAWEVRERDVNPAARAFWLKAIGAFTNGAFEEEVADDVRWRGWVQRFVSA